MKIFTRFLFLVSLVFLINCSDDDPDEMAMDCSTSDLSLVVESTNSECSNDTGTISVTATGGDGDYQYSLNSGALQSASVFSNVAIGSYEVAVVDGSGCSSTQVAFIRTSVSLVNDIMPLLETQCTFSGCHNGDNGSSRNWLEKGNVLAMAENIKARTQNGSMPRNPGVLTQAEIDLIACWVDDGAEDN